VLCTIRQQFGFDVAPDRTVRRLQRCDRGDGAGAFELLDIEILDPDEADFPFLLQIG
jgi:hypothetical protein